MDLCHTIQTYYNGSDDIWCRPFKKTIIADTFAISANIGFAPGFEHNFISAWVASLSYTFQLYFDFSGYCDMAVGAALLFNIWLPINFNSPYKALDIQDFWRRWHITLGRYLRDYLYIPLGGNRCPTFRVYINLFITFVLGGYGMVRVGCLSFGGLTWARLGYS